MSQSEKYVLTHTTTQPTALSAVQRTHNKNPANLMLVRASTTRLTEKRNCSGQKSGFDNWSLMCVCFSMLRNVGENIYI